MINAKQEDFAKVERIIRSCKNMIQSRTAENIVENFGKFYGSGSMYEVLYDQMCKQREKLLCESASRAGKAAVDLMRLPAEPAISLNYFFKPPFNYNHC